MSTKKNGAICWVDLTVEDADQVRDFYQEVVGWGVDSVSMGEYDDYCMKPGESDAVAGICHARSSNAGLPPYWLIYVNVDDLDESMKRCQEGGGQIVSGPRLMPGHGRYCVIQDPAGAFCGLFEHEKPAAK